MKRVVFFLSSFLVYGYVFSQQVPRHFHPEMYGKDTIHIDADSTLYFIDNLGSNINEGHKSAGARVSPDGKTLYFFKVGHVENLKGSRDIWVSHLNPEDGTWLPATRMPEPVNNFSDNIVYWVSNDGKKLLLHERYQKNKMSVNGLSMSELQADSKWSFPKSVKIKKYKNVDICSFDMSPDEEVLLLAIKQPNNTLGQQDIYVSFKIKPYKYSKPVNLGSVINTKGIEATAFLASNGKSIYFSSNGHPNSLGGFEIYESKRLDDTWMNWSKPRHIGAPFNTEDDDLYFSTPQSGDYVYLSRHFGGNKETNVYSDIIRIKLKEIDPLLQLSGSISSIYNKKKIPSKIKYVTLIDNKTDSTIYFDTTKIFTHEIKGRKSVVAMIEAPDHKTLYDTIDLNNAKPGRTKLMKEYKLQILPAFFGKVYSAKDSNTSIPANIVVYNKETKQVIFSGKVDAAPDSLIKVYVNNGKYNYTIRSEGFLKDTNELDMSNIDKLGRTRKNFYLQKIEVGLTFTIKNILFKYNKHELETYSFWELDRIAEIMYESPNLEVEIAGHTDNLGNDAYNLALSQRRANSVVQYLKSKGVRNIVHAKGYGESKPIEKNLTPEGRGMNRRVEFVVLNIKDPKMFYKKPIPLKVGMEKPAEINPLDITK
jgi:OmpA-OmpF porin, OOP family